MPTTATPTLLDPSTLVLHERVEPARLARLITAMNLSQSVDNPVVVTYIAGTPMVLDGAHRTTAARHLGLARLPVHVIASEDVPQSVGWTHVVQESACELVLARLRALDVDSSDRAGRTIAVVRHHGANRPCRTYSNEPAALVHTNRNLAAAYADLPYERAIAPRDGSNALHITYLPLGLQHIVEAVQAAGPLPAGVTRFLCPPVGRFAPIPFAQLHKHPTGR